MAANRKEYELLFQLKAALGPNFASSFKTAMQTTKQLQGSLDEVRKVQSNITGYKKQYEAAEENKKKLAMLVAEHEKLQREMQETENPSNKLRQSFEKNEKQIAATTSKIEEQERKLEGLGNELRRAGVDTGNLNGENERLRETYNKVAKEQEQLAGVIAAQEKNAAVVVVQHKDFVDHDAVAKFVKLDVLGVVALQTAIFLAHPDCPEVVSPLKDSDALAPIFRRVVCCCRL